MTKTAPTTTAGYDVYWRFAAERQNVYLRRVAGASERENDYPHESPRYARPPNLVARP